MPADPGAAPAPTEVSATAARRQTRRAGRRVAALIAGIGVAAAAVGFVLYARVSWTPADGVLAGVGAAVGVALMVVAVLLVLAGAVVLVLSSR